MRKNFGAKTWTYPQPVFILATYNEDGTPDIATVLGPIDPGRKCLSPGTEFLSAAQSRLPHAFQLAGV